MLPPDGTTSFAALQQALSEKRPERLHLYLFDLLRLEGRDLRETPLLERKTPPFTDPPTGADARGVHWVTPKLVCEVGFTEWTGDGRLRHPSFQGLREDKDPAEVTRERPREAPAEKALTARRAPQPRRPGAL